MNHPSKSPLVFLFIILLALPLASFSQSLSEFKSRGANGPVGTTINHQEQFNGYTKYWHDNYNLWFRYGNLFKIATPDIKKTILQSKLDVAEELGLPGLLMQEGFLASLFSNDFKILKNPTQKELEEELGKSSILCIADPDTEIGKILSGKDENSYSWPSRLKAHQYDDVNLKSVRAFVLYSDNIKLHVISTEDIGEAEKLIDHIENTRAILNDYQLHKGWFGAKSLLKSVTCSPGHPLDLISRGMNEGCSWFIFDGYMDFMAQNELKKWMKDVDLPVVVDAGFSPIYGCKNYEGLQVQDMATKEAWYEYAKSKGGYLFKPVYDEKDEWAGARFDGYVAIEGNKEQIDNENIPFVSESGFLADNLTSSMMLFIEKSKLLSRESIWEAIMDRREVAILEGAKMMGPAKYRNALQLLYIDRVYLEEYYKDRIDIRAATKDYNLTINISNYLEKPVSGILELSLPFGMDLADNIPAEISIPANSEKQITIKLKPSAESMNYTNPVGVHFSWEGKQKSTLAMLDLPPAISLHKVLYANSSDIIYPVSVHNFSAENKVSVKLEVYPMTGAKKPVLTQTEIVNIERSKHVEIPFEIKLNAGEYLIKVSALGISEEGQLGVESAGGESYLYEMDLNSDGIMEYRMENDSVQVTLLTTGARVIEYIVKSRSDNVLFKIWPKKAPDDNRPFRKRGFYPYGGFEDFLGQGSMETHRVYDAIITKDKGEYVQVIMETDYFGNKLQKTFTLYGNSPLLEVRFALDFKNPEANVIGPQPILELGEAHWTEDVFTALTTDGLKEYRMRPEEYYGGIIYLQEGWNAGYDTKADVNFVGAFPVDQPLYLHMWMNHPVNRESHHYYVEFQPWVPIIQKNTFYFSYYLWGSGGHWENGVKELRKRNLISIYKD